MFSCFLENPIELFLIYRIKYRNEDIVRFDGSLLIEGNSFWYDGAIKNCYVGLLSPIVWDKVFICKALFPTWVGNCLQSILPIGSVPYMGRLMPTVHFTSES